MNIFGIDTPDAVSGELVVVQSSGALHTGMQTGEWACWYMEGYDGSHLLIQVSPGPWTRIRCKLSIQEPHQLRFRKV